MILNKLLLADPQNTEINSLFLKELNYFGTMID